MKEHLWLMHWAVVTSRMAADATELERHRPALTGHCYRMLGSAVDAEDAVQETMVRAWRGLSRFDGRSSVRTWLFKIATNVCLDAVADHAHRVRPVETGPVSSADDALETKPRSHWLEPIADARILPSDAGPDERAVLRESIRLAFVAALQTLPPKQRAALLLTDVLDWSAAEVAESFDTTLASVNSAIQRARATLAARPQSPKPASGESQAMLVERYVSAFERYDIPALTALLHHDATLSMPPYTMWLQGHAAIGTWMLGRGSGCRGSRLVPTRASGQAAFGQYRPSPSGGHEAWALLVLEVGGDRIASVTSFLGVEALFPHFDLPLRL